LNVVNILRAGHAAHGEAVLTEILVTGQRLDTYTTPCAVIAALGRCAAPTVCVSLVLLVIITVAGVYQFRTTGFAAWPLCS
jgi:hypothetical protein